MKFWDCRIVWSLGPIGLLAQIPHTRVTNEAKNEQGLKSPSSTQKMGNILKQEKISWSKSILREASYLKNPGLK